jgi:Trk K+ transport system NAD-binding subunit
MNREDFFFLVISKIRKPIIFLITIYAISMIGLVLIPGLDNEGNPYNMGFFDAFFIVVYTSTTVGFGEMPFAWTYSQKFWMSITTLSSVTAWIVCIGQIIVLLQDKHVKIQKNIYFFSRKLKNIKTPFYIIAGFGNTGKNLAQLMSNHGSDLVIIDSDPVVIETIQFLDFKSNMIAINGDIQDLEFLKLIGVCNPYCQGLILTTNNENSNTQAALSAKILNSNLKVISRASSSNNKRNLESFGTDHVVSPYFLFTNSLVEVLTEKESFKIKNLLTNENFDFVDSNIPSKNWVIIGYKKYGRILHKKLNKLSIDCKILDKDIDKEKYKTGIYIKGDGVDGIDLNEADISKSEVIVATHEDDFINLSSIITAKKINENIFSVAIVNNFSNKLLFEKIGVDIIFHPYELMVRKIFSLISEPLLNNFFQIIEKESVEYKKKFLERLSAFSDKELIVWHINIDEDNTPTIYDYIKDKKETKLKDIVFSEKYYTLNTIPLLIIKGDKQIIEPSLDSIVEYDDLILFAGNGKVKHKMEWVINNATIFEDNYNSYRDNKEKL